MPNRGLMMQACNAVHCQQVSIIIVHTRSYTCTCSHGGPLQIFTTIPVQDEVTQPSPVVSDTLLQRCKPG